MLRVFRTAIWSLFLIHCTSNGSLQESLVDLLKYTKFTPDLNANSSGTQHIARRCQGYLACEFHVPVVELKNVSFQNGVVMAEGDPEYAISLGKKLKKLYAAKEGHLPSCLVQTATNLHSFVAGPAYRIVSQTDCASYRNESAFFTFPWEEDNAFHSLNDNLLPVLAQVYLQSLFQHENLADLSSRVLYRFRGWHGHEESTIFKLFPLLFPQSKPAGEIMRGGPHCIQKAVWGSGMKVLYRDSIQHLRYQLYSLLRRALIPHLPRGQKKSKDNQRPKVIIITRNDRETTDASKIARKLNSLTEERMVKIFNDMGADAMICCDFNSISVQEYLTSIWDVDICVSIHGAGLANCVLGSPGSVMVEMHVHHNFGFDGFMKIAHMTRGQYIFANIKSSTLTKQGHLVNDEVLHDLSALALKLHAFSKKVQHIIEPRTKPTLLSNKANTSAPFLNSETNRDRVMKSIYKEDVVINFQQETFYVDQEAKSDQKEFVQQVLGFKNFKPRNRSEHVVQNNGKRMREYWIFPNPYLHMNEDEREGILGPTMEDNYAHCIQLPYFKLRLMTSAHTQKKLECDRNIIIAKRSGYEDHVLTSSLLP